MARLSLVLASLAVLVGCGGTCGTYEVSGTDLEVTSAISGKTFDVDGTYREQCGARFGTVANPILDEMEFWMRPDGGSGAEDATVASFIGLALFLPLEDFVDGARFEWSDAVSSRGCFEDNLHTCMSEYTAPLADGYVELSDASACDDVGGAQYTLRAEWDLTWGDPSGDGVWFTAEGRDRIDVILGGDCPEGL